MRSSSFLTRCKTSLIIGGIATAVLCLTTPSFAVTAEQITPWIDVASQILSATLPTDSTTPNQSRPASATPTNANAPTAGSSSPTDRVLQVAQVLGALSQNTGAGALNTDTVTQAIRDTLLLSSDRAGNGMTSADAMSSQFSDKTLMALTALRLMGYGPQIDKLQSSLMTGGSQAIQQARPIFTQAIKNMSIVDAYKIVTGGPDAATRYFRAQTENQVKDQFRHLLQSKLQNSGYYTYYQLLEAGTLLLPARKRIKLDFESAIVNKSVDRYYAAMADEEAKIRKDPIGQGSKLIATVLGAR